MPAASTSSASAATHILIRVPGSIANLGPGFDTLAVAIDLYLEVQASPLPGTGDISFRFPDGAPQGSNSVERAFRFMVEQTGIQPPSLDVQVRSELPARSGLGSSAAATIAGLHLFSRACRPLATEEILHAAYQLEGHPDNVSASLLGGLTVSMERRNGSIAAVCSAWPAGIHFLVLTPKYALSTRDARKVLPQEVPLRDAVHNLQRVAMLMWAMSNGDLSGQREAFSDALHQPYRERLVPGLADVLALEHPDLIATSLSGAGPSLVAFTRGRASGVEELVRATYSRTGHPFELRWLTAALPHPQEPRPRTAR